MEGLIGVGKVKGKIKRIGQINRRINKIGEVGRIRKMGGIGKSSRNSRSGKRIVEGVIERRGGYRDWERGMIGGIRRK